MSQTIPKVAIPRRRVCNSATSSELCCFFFRKPPADISCTRRRRRKLPLAVSWTRPQRGIGYHTGFTTAVKFINGLLGRLGPRRAVGEMPARLIQSPTRQARHPAGRAPSKCAPVIPDEFSDTAKDGLDKKAGTRRLQVYTMPWWRYHSSSR